MRDLAWLTAVAEHGNVTDAAATLGVNQPTLSRAISRVEAELGTRLFERVPSGVLVNPDGDLALTAVREITARYDRLRADLGDRRDPDSGVLRLAFLDSMATSLVPQLLRAFHTAAPGVRVQLRQEPGHEMVRDLLSGAAEVAITSGRSTGPFGWIPLQHERLVLVVPSTHHLRRRKRVSIEEVGSDEIITTPVGFGFRSLVDALFAEAGMATPTVSFESGDLATIEGLVSAGLGIAVVPEQFAGASGSIGLHLTSPAARRVVGLTWCDDRVLAPPAQRFLDFVEHGDWT